MKCNRRWLQEWIDGPLNSEILAQKLTAAGLEVDHIEKVAADFTHVVTGQILTVEKHPQADQLHLCQVNVGGPSPLTIVCGAINLKVGMKVAVALVGATIGDIQIKKAKIRGIESNGMMCSAKELGLVTEETGKNILELEPDIALGLSVRDELKLDDESLVIELTANRGDCANVRGIAREAAVLLSAPFREPAITAVPSKNSDRLSVKVVKPEACSRYVGRIIRNIHTATTPWEIKEKLRRCGFNSIHPVVDVLNYVMLELGQPMHAFDLSKLSGSIEVREARAGEAITLLNDSSVKLDPDTLVIADKKGAVAIAGIMGGKNSAISSTTRDLFLESAFFVPHFINGRAKKYKIPTESSYRFERGVDPQLPIVAMERATALLLKIVGGEPGPVMDYLSDQYYPTSSGIEFNLASVKRLLGISIPEVECKKILEQLGMKIEKVGKDQWKVIPPSYRFDIHIEADLVEEIARIYGYDKIPTIPFCAPTHITPIQRDVKLINQLREILRDRSYHEILSYSFIDPKDQQLLAPQKKNVTLSNPISPEMSVMRASLWPGLLNTLIYNLNRQQKRVRLFEIGLRFYYEQDQLMQDKVLGGLVYGPIFSEQWNDKEREVDFFDIKGDVENLLTSMNRNTLQVEFRSQPTHSGLHPSQSAAIFAKKVSSHAKQQDEFSFLGFIGLLHPQIAQKKEIKGDVYLFELDLKRLLDLYQLPSAGAISKFPSIRRDLAFVVDKKVSAAQIQAIIIKICKEWLIDYIVFDVYTGAPLKEQEKSIALGLILQHPNRTLLDEEVNHTIAQVVAALEKDLNAKLRK